MYFHEAETPNRKYKKLIPKKNHSRIKVKMFLPFMNKGKRPTFSMRKCYQEKKNVDLIWGKFGEQKAKIVVMTHNVYTSKMSC